MVLYIEYIMKMINPHYNQFFKGVGYKMHIGLMKDNSYKIFEKDKEIKKDNQNLKYLIVDISTKLKGPLHTLVKGNKLNLDNLEDMIMEMEVYYDTASFDDYPSSNYHSFPQKYVLDSIGRKYNLNPLILQYVNFNEYHDNFLVANYITIGNILLDNKIINGDSDDMNFSRTLENLNLMTHVKSLKGNHIILANNVWHIDKKIPKKFDYILYNLEEIESLYLLSYKQYKRFCKVDQSNIELYYLWNDTEEFESLIMNNKASSEGLEPDNYKILNGIKELLESFIYFPQFSILERAVNNTEVVLKIYITKGKDIIRLTISKEEFSTIPISLFSIYNTLLKI